MQNIPREKNLIKLDIPSVSQALLKSKYKEDSVGKSMTQIFMLKRAITSKYQTVQKNP